MDDDIQYLKQYGLCEYCGKQGRVTFQLLNGSTVNVYCKRCDPGDEREGS